MVANVDRTDTLKLDVEDFNRAMGWLIEAELSMPYIFEAGTVTPDSRVMDELAHFIKTKKGAVPEHIVVNFCRQRVASNSIKPIIEGAVQSRLILAVLDDKGRRQFTVP